MIDIPLHRHLYSAGQRFENAFYLMVLVLAFRFDIQIHLGGIAQGCLLYTSDAADE